MLYVLLASVTRHGWLGVDFSACASVTTWSRSSSHRFMSPIRALPVETPNLGIRQVADSAQPLVRTCVAGPVYWPTNALPDFELAGFSLRYPVPELARTTV